MSQFQKKFSLKKLNEINVLTYDIKIIIYSSKLSKENYFIFIKTYPKEKSLFVYFQHTFTM